LLDEPSLKKFLDFRLSAGDLEESKVEYAQYNNEITTISRFYAEASAFGQQWERLSCLLVSCSTNHLETLRTIEYTNYSANRRVCSGNDCHESKWSSVIKRFWKLQNENQNIMMKNKLIEEKIIALEEKAKAKVRKLQTAQHVTITTVATEQIQQYAKSTTASIAKRFLDNDNEKTAKRTRTHKDQPDEDDSESDEDRDYLDDGEKSPWNSNSTPPNPFELAISHSSKISNRESIRRASAESLASLDGVKYFREFIPLFEKYKEQEKHNVYSCTNDDVMDIRGDSGFAKFLTIDQYTKLLSVRPKRNAVLPEFWCRIIEEYYMESLTEGGPKKTITDWVHITYALIVDKVGDTEGVKRLKKYLHRVMLPFAPDFNEHHYWSEFGHHFFSKALQEFAGLDWRAMEVPVFASKYKKNHGLDHAIHKQAGPPTKPDLTKLSMDSFKLYRELRDCLNVRLLYAMEIGDVNYSNRAVFGILGYLFEIKMLIMWKDGVYVYEEFGSFTVASHSSKIHMMKVESESTVKVEHDNDKVQILKRKFSDIIQRKPSQLKELPELEHCSAKSKSPTEPEPSAISATRDY
ncbi:7316_t:CDS:10, partial [Ambispora gerdemannii]